MADLTPGENDRRQNSPPLQGRGRGWGLSANTLARLHGHAAKMRRDPTEPEKRLWARLSRSQLGGFKFRRQATIGSIIVDFLCPQAGLIVEVDGDSHGDPAADVWRDGMLAGKGYRVVRVTNTDVMANIAGVLEHLLTVALSRERHPAEHPHPNPSPEGEGLGASQTEPSGTKIDGRVA